MIELRCLDLWLPAEDYAVLERYAGECGCTPERVLADLVRRLPAGPASVTCDGCGMRYQPPRAPRAGVHHWCPTCQREGRDLQARQEAYRDRRRSRMSPNGVVH